MAKRPKKVLTVTFGGSSVGKTVGRVGVTIHRSACDIDQANELFCDTRLSGTIEITPKKAAKGQTSMLPDQFPKLEGVFDVKGFRVTSEKISCGLTFNRKSVDVNAMGEFAGQSGKLSIMDIASIPAEEATNGDADAEAGEADQEAEEEDE